MEQTLFLAQFLGVFSIILSVSIILRRKMIVHIVKDIMTNRALAYFIGIMEVAAGLLLVLSHSEWANTLGSVVTIFGWLLLAEGIMYLFATKSFLKKFISMLDNMSAYYFFSLLYLVLGLYLVNAGFGLGFGA